MVINTINSIETFTDDFFTYEENEESGNFRTIDLNQIFNDTILPKNWSGENAIQVINEIQSVGDNIWVDKDPFYSITLTPETIKKIKSYNNDKEKYDGYLDDSLSCSAYNNCNSTFLDNAELFNSTNYNSVFSKGGINTLPQGNKYLYQKSN